MIIWRWIWHPDYGVANQIVKFFGGEPQVWLSDPDLVKFCIIFPGVLGGGLTVLLYLSAIQGVSTDIMESAALDGCTGFKKIRHIILPNISFMIFIQLIMCVITTMQTAGCCRICMHPEAPSGASTTQGIFIYNAFNDDLNYGRGSAASVVLLIVIAVLTMLQMHFEKSEKN
ncbi:MAG: carbohydrate ABC transporter permease [Mediterraneibacter gnavus]